MTDEKTPGLICPGCDERLFPIRESPDFPDATYSETCSYCYEEYSYTVKSGEVELWKPPKGISQAYNGVGKPGGRKE